MWFIYVSSMLLAGRYVMCNQTDSTVHEDCALHDDCGTNQFCDPAIGNKCRCKSGFFLWKWSCHEAKKYGMGCKLNNECYHDDVNMRCVYIPSNQHHRCECAADYYYDGKKCRFDSSSNSSTTLRPTLWPETDKFARSELKEGGKDGGLIGMLAIGFLITIIIAAAWGFAMCKVKTRILDTLHYPRAAYDPKQLKLSDLSQGSYTNPGYLATISSHPSEANEANNDLRGVTVSAESKVDKFSAKENANIAPNDLVTFRPAGVGSADTAMPLPYQKYVLTDTERNDRSGF